MKKLMVNSEEYHRTHTGILCGEKASILKKKNAKFVEG